MTTSNYTSKIRVKYLQKIIQLEVIINSKKGGKKGLIIV